MKRLLTDEGCRLGTCGSSSETLSSDCAKRPLCLVLVRNTGLAFLQLTDEGRKRTIHEHITANYEECKRNKESPETQQYGGPTFIVSEGKTMSDSQLRPEVCEVTNQSCEEHSR